MVQAGKQPADKSVIVILVCRSCGGVLIFGDHGWEHRDPGRGCDDTRVAWPPPRQDDEEEVLSEAG
jgi:hypothetical protein